MPTWFHDCYSHNIRGVGQEGICITDHGQNWTRDCRPIGDLFICQPLENSLGIHMSATWKWFGDDGSTCICSIQMSGTEIQWGVTCLSLDLQQKGYGRPPDNSHGKRTTPLQQAAGANDGWRIRDDPNVAAATAGEAWAGRRGRDRSCLRRIRCYGESREE